MEENVDGTGVKEAVTVMMRDEYNLYVAGADSPRFRAVICLFVF